MLNLQRAAFFAFTKTMLCVVLLTALSTTANAQINNNRFRVNLNSLDMGPCGGVNDAYSRIGVLAKNNTVNNFEIAFDLPDGVDFIPGTEIITFQEGSSDFTLTVVDMTDLNAPVFRLERPANANWQVADLVRFRFDKTASCQAVAFSYGGGLFKDAHTITYEDNNGSQSVSDNDPTINSYNFFRAYLAVGNYNSISASIGQSLTRTLEISNAGNGTIQDFDHRVFVENDIGAYTFSFVDLAATRHALTPIATNVTPGGTEYIYQVDLGQAPFLGNIGDGDLEFENESALFEESFDAIGCNESNIDHQPTWGCSPTETCQSLEPVSADIVFNEQSPEINVARVPSSHDDLCGTTTHSVIISNDASSAIAYGVRINFGFAWSSSVLTTDTQNGMFGNDNPTYDTKSISNFRFGSNPSFAVPQRLTTQWAGYGAGSYFIGDNFFPTTGPDPDGPGGLEDLDGDGFYDDLAPGATTQLSMDSDINPRTNACGASSVDYISPKYLTTDVYAQDQCGVLTPTDRARSQYTYLRRQAVNTDSPTDIYNGQSFALNVTGSIYGASDEVPYCNGNRFFSNDPGSSYTITLTVPDGISLAGTPAGFTQPDANTIIYTTTDMPSSNTLTMNADFPVTFDCGVYSGPKNIPISYTTRYTCDCFDEIIHCGTFNSVRSQCGGPCDGPTITAFDANRETAGWTDETMTTPVVLDASNHNVNMYMAKDEMVINATGVLVNANPDNLHFDLTYNTPAGVAAGGEDIIRFVSGSMIINDLSSGSTLPIALAAPVLNTNGTTTHRLTFDLSSYTTNVSPTYTYGEPLIPLGAPQADEVDLELHFVFEEDFTTRVQYELQDFTGDFYNYDALSNRVSCNILGDRAYYFKHYNNPYDRTSTNATGCNPVNMELLWHLQSLPGNPFPNEYRPPVIWQSSVVEIPAGAQFTGTVSSVQYPGNPTNSNGGFITSLVGNTLTITPGPNFLNADQNGTQYPRLYVGLIGSSASAPSTTFNWTTNYEEFGYSSAPVARSRTDSHPFNFTSPDYSLTTTSPITSGDQASASYEVDLCMDFTQDVDFNWLQINNGTDFTVVGAYEIIGATRNPLTFSESGGQTWVETGQYLTGASCKKIGFDIAFTRCNNFDFVVENAWDCDSYPSDFTIGNYSNPLTLRLEPKEAALQIAILDEPSGTIDICSNFNIDLELRNAGNGDLIDPVITFDIPGDATSMDLNNLFVSYPSNTAAQPVTFTTVVNTVTLNLMDHPAIAANSGLQGSLNASAIEEQIAIVQLDLQVQCNFVSSSAITYEARGNNPCGTPATGSGSRLSTNPIVVDGAEPVYDAISTISVPPGGLFAGCGTETITVQTTIAGGPTSNLDYARIILPDGLAFDPTTFASNNPAYPVTYGAITTVGNHEEFTVFMPDGANNGADPNYSFDVTPKNTVTTCSPGTQIEVNNFVVTSGLSCGAVSCGTTEISNGSTFEDVIITKPQLVESTFTSNADYTTDGSGNYEYHIEFGVENTGTVDIAAGFVYDVFCADSGGTKTGSSIFNGTVSQAITTGSSITEDILFTTNSFCGDNGNLVVEFLPSNTNCHCDVLSIPFTSEPEVSDLEVTSSVVPVNVNIGDTVTFTIDVLNNGLFDATNILIENNVPHGYIVAGINDGGTQTGNVISWPIFDLINANSTTFSFTATVNTPTSTANEYDNITQVVNVDQFDSDSTPNNYDGLPLEDDESITTVNLLMTDLSLAMGLSTTSIPNPQVGENGTMELTLTNNGPDAATDVVIDNMIPVGLTVDGGSISNGGSLSSSNVSWPIPSINSGESLTLSFTFTVNNPSGATGEYTNMAQVQASDQFDPDSTPDNFTGTPIEDDEASYDVNTQPTVDIEILKTADKADSYFEDIVVFTITANNIGIDQATNISIEDILPNGFQLDSVTATLGTYDEMLGEWIITALGSAESAELQMTTTVLDGISHTNTATLSFVDQVDINPDNDSASVTINVTQDRCLTVFNEFSPNNDGANEFFFIECIEQYPNNKLEVFNRWGTKVFEMEGYDNSWDGTSMGRATINASEKLPVGTYYYTLDPRDGGTDPKSGWLYISR